MFCCFPGGSCRLLSAFKPGRIGVYAVGKLNRFFWDAWLAWLSRAFIGSNDLQQLAVVQAGG